MTFISKAFLFTKDRITSPPTVKNYKKIQKGKNCP